MCNWHYIVSFCTLYVLWIFLTHLSMNPVNEVIHCLQMLLRYSIDKDAYMSTKWCWSLIYHHKNQIISSTPMPSLKKFPQGTGMPWGTSQEWGGREVSDFVLWQQKYKLFRTFVANLKKFHQDFPLISHSQEWTYLGSQWPLSTKCKWMHKNKTHISFVWNLADDVKIYFQYWMWTRPCAWTSLWLKSQIWKSIESSLDVSFKSSAPMVEVHHWW